MTDSADRMRKLRERRAMGIRMLHVPVQIDTVEALVELDYLDVEDSLDFESIADALSRFVEDATSSVTCNGITLDSW